MRSVGNISLYLVGISCLGVFGCSVAIPESAREITASELIATPPAQYSTFKARALGTRYKDNVDRLVASVMSNPRTANLRFANNIAALGGIGFFTHSAVKSPDERFLEVVLGSSETFEVKGDHSTKLARMFLLYGAELLGILYRDQELYRDPDVAGYGLNFSWSTVVAEGSGMRKSRERAVAYVGKDKVRAYLNNRLDANELLAGAVIFVGEDQGPMSLVSFRAQRQAPDYRPPIEEQVLLPSVTTATVPGEAGQEKGADGPVGQQSADLEVEWGLTELSDAGKALAHGARYSPETGSGVLLPSPEMAVERDREEEGRSGRSLMMDLGGVPGVAAAGEHARVLAAKDTLDLPATGAVVSEISPPAREPAGLSESPQGDELSARSGETMDEGLVSAGQLPPREEDVDEPLGQNPGTLAEFTAEATNDTGEEISFNGNLSRETEDAAVSTPSLSAAIEIPTEGPNFEVLPQPSSLAVPTEISHADANSGVTTREERLALAREKPAEKPLSSKSLARPVPRALEGFVIQIYFSDKIEARRWAEVWEGRGYAVSVTASAASESLRLRIGNFRIRNDAEREVQRLKRDGLDGIILNLPEGFQPDSRPSVP